MKVLKYIVVPEESINQNLDWKKNRWNKKLFN